MMESPDASSSGCLARELAVSIVFKKEFGMLVKDVWNRACAGLERIAENAHSGTWVQQAGLQVWDGLGWLNNLISARGLLGFGV